MVLANALISALPSYGMQIQWYPQAICDYLDKTTSRFIWKGSEGKGRHLVSWKKMIRSRNLGGFGTRAARNHNTALLGKVVWDILDSEDKLWVYMFKELYIKGGNIFNAVNVKAPPHLELSHESIKGPLRCL